MGTPLTKLVMRVGHLGLIFVVGLLAAFAAAELFDELDGDSSGSLDHEEYEHFLEGLVEPNDTCFADGGHAGFHDVDTNGDEGLSEAEFEGALEHVLETLFECHDSHEHGHDDDHASDDHEDEEAFNAGQRWLYGLLAISGMALISIGGVLILPFSKWRGSIMLDAMIAFGAGTLIGDAVLHLIPLAIMDEDTTSASVGAFILAGVFLFFLMEKALHHHHHNYYDHHNQEDLELEETRSGDGLRQKKQGKKVARASSSADRNDDTSASASNSTTATSTLLDTISAPHSASKHGDEPIDPEIGVCHRVSVVGWLNLVADNLHNLADGLVVGATLHLSVEATVATVLAIFFHELPQELGDYAILIRAGFTKKQALLFNFLASLSAFVGLVIGLIVGESSAEANIWILSFVAGGFLYLAMSDVIPELHTSKQKGHVAAQSIFMALGFGAMYLVLVLEDVFASEDGHDHDY